MKDYTERKVLIGKTDMSALILVGYTEDGLETELLHFGDGERYEAYIVESEDVEIPAYYNKHSEFTDFVKVYDDTRLTKTFKGEKIEIYRAGDTDTLIKIIK